MSTKRVKHGWRNKKLIEGDKVKCTNARFFNDSQLPFNAKDIKLPELGKIYTVRDVIKTKHGVGIRLKEIKNKKFFFDDIKKIREPIFATERFKKVI